MRFIIDDPLKISDRVRPIEGYIDDNGCYICDSHKPCSDGRYYVIHRFVEGIKRPIMLHRYVYETYVGEIPTGLIVRHKCDNVLCVNPIHLELGTIKDNINDMIVRGRSTKGEKNAQSKLTSSNVKDIKNLLAAGEKTQQEIASIFGVSQRTISYIKNGELWSHV